MDVKSICRYIQGNNDNDLVFDSSNKMVVDFYADANFEGLWVNENAQEPIFDRIRNGFVENFTNYPLFWVSKVQTYISPYTMRND